LSQQDIIPVVNLAEREIDPKLLSLIPIKVLKKHTVVPINRRGSTITVATSDPSNIFAADELKFITGYNIELVVAQKDDIERLLGIVNLNPMLAGAGTKGLEPKDDSDPNYDAEGHADAASDLEMDDFHSLISGAVDDVEVIETEDDDDLSTDVDAPIIKLVNSVLLKAIQMRVSDIHVEPYEKSVRVRYRLDGVLKKVMSLPAQIKNQVLSRLKIMAHLDIAEKRLPQDGRIRLKISKTQMMDFRVSSLPTIYGEKIVLRLLDKSNLQLDMTKLGFDGEKLDEFREAINQPWGMVLVTGPTGSGKTTTLYSALVELNTEFTNIITAEDPVEYNLNGINQVQMSENIGLTFASALRSFLRQDPDVILVGEIRDFETAEIAIKAALTGHLVLSTLHTNDAPSTINRMVNMGVEPFLVSSAVNLILAQRLARKICPKCKKPVDTQSAILEKMGLSIAEIQSIQQFSGEGCDNCSQSGCRGRVALYEVMSLNQELKDMIVFGASTTELKEKAIEAGMDSLRMAGLKKLRVGDISLEEVLRVTKAD